MQFLDRPLGKGGGSLIDDIVDSTEVVLRLQDVIDSKELAIFTYRSCFEDESRLVERDLDSLDVVVVVCELNYNFVIDPPLRFRGFFFAQP